MSKTAVVTREEHSGESLNIPTPDEIRQQLGNILASPPFHGSKRCHQFLEYVCEQALAGEVGALKERTIAIAVFGRQPQSDLGEDTIVRVGAREVRKRLAQYYVTPEGAASKVRIDLPSGAYAPEFHYITQSHEEGAAPATLVISAAQRRPGWRRPLLAACGALLVALSAWIAVRLVAANPNAVLFQEFWAPVYKSAEPLVVAVAHPIVYHPSRRIQKLSEALQPPQDEPLQRTVQIPANQKMDGSDLVPVLNQYVGFGDMVAANEVSQMMARKSKEVRLRLASGIEFADLRNQPSFLVGAITNRWTMELQQGWRFKFASRDLATVIADSQQPGQQWTIPAKEDGSSPEDYILICRIRNSFTGGFTIVAAGLKQFGTEAAGRLLVDSDQLGGTLRKLKPGWESKNLQFVLHARVIGNTPAKPEVVASYVW
jgi:hypothetical protein